MIIKVLNLEYMQTLILSIIGALTIGGGIGWSLHNNDRLANQSENESVYEMWGRGNGAGVANREFNDTGIVASDYVSVRPGVAALPVQSLSETETAGLLLMREEEKLARDVYETLYDKWGLQIFSNISQSEQTHAEAVRTIIVKYNLEDPVVDDTIGVFVNSDMKKLYNDLTTKGLVSLEEALIVGATIEDLDIFDLQKLIADTDNEDIKLVYENLLRGSRNHLRAFTSQLKLRNTTYTPQYITQGDFESIVTSEQEKGSGNGAGGRGWGKKN